MAITVGLIGLGLMGKPMGRNLLKAGFPLVVWNRTKSKADDLVREGAKLAANPREVATQVDVLITIVSDPPALEEVMFGANGALDALKRGSLFIDSSTVSRNWRGAKRPCAPTAASTFLTRPSPGAPGVRKKASWFL